MIDRLLLGSCTDEIYLAVRAVTRGRGLRRVPVAFALFIAIVMWLAGSVISHEFGTNPAVTIAAGVTLGVLVGVAVCVADGLPAQRELAAAEVLVASGMPVDEAARRSVAAGVSGRHAILDAARADQPPAR